MPDILIRGMEMRSRADMTKEKKREGLILSYDGMIWAESLMDTATSRKEQRIARAMYESFWCLWTVLRDNKATTEGSRHDD